MHRQVEIQEASEVVKSGEVQRSKSSKSVQARAIRSIQSVVVLLRSSSPVELCQSAPKIKKSSCKSMWPNVDGAIN